MIQQQILQTVILEACVNSYQDALEKYQKGANRIELCDNLYQGGTTPSYGTILKCKQNISIPIICMIRPRGGNFVYSQDEIEIMENDIKICKQIGIQGVVFGILDQNNQIDYEANLKLIKISKPLETCFHMAIDETQDIFNSLELIIKLGFDRVLTKGGNFQNAFQGIENLKKMINQANGRIIIMPGKGITSINKKKIIEETNASQIHGTQIV